MKENARVMMESVPWACWGVPEPGWSGHEPLLREEELRNVKSLILENTIAGQELGEAETIEARLDLIQQSPAERLKWRRVLGIAEVAFWKWAEGWLQFPITAFEIAEKDMEEARAVFSLPDREQYEWWYNLPPEESSKWLEKIGWSQNPPQMSPEEWSYCYWFSWAWSAAELISKGIRVDLQLEKPCNPKDLMDNAKMLLLEAEASWKGLERFGIPIDYFTGYLREIQAGNVFLRGVLALEDRELEVATLSRTAEHLHGSAQFHAGKRVGRKEARFLVLEAQEEAQRKEVELLEARHEKEKLAGALERAERLAEEKEAARLELRLAEWGAKLTTAVAAGIRPAVEAAREARDAAVSTRNTAQNRQRGTVPLQRLLEVFEAVEAAWKRTPHRTEKDVVADVWHDFGGKKLGITEKTLRNRFHEWAGMKRPRTVEDYKAAIEAARKAKKRAKSGGKKAVGRKSKKGG